MKAVGIFGGTFDPVHIGHLRTAVELREHLGLDELHLMPSARPPHREDPCVSAEHRLAMLRLAIGDAKLDGSVEGDGLLADDRELRRQGPSYMVETLALLRRELGDDVALYLCIGMDSLVNLHTWHRWQELSDYAHIVVAARPGWHLPETGSVAQWLAGRYTDDVQLLSNSPSGYVLVEAMTLLPVSATQIRKNLATGYSVRYLVPDRVIQYIHQHGLYKQENT